MDDNYLLYKKSRIRLFINFLVFLSAGFGIFNIWLKDFSTATNYLLVAPMAFFIPRLFFNHLGLHRHFSLGTLKIFEMTLPVFFGVTVADALWFHNKIFYFDWIAHFVYGALIAFLIFIAVLFFEKRFQLISSRFIASAVMFSVSLAVAVLWEVFEYVVNILLGSNLVTFGDPLVSLWLDTFADIATSAAGSLVMVLVNSYYWAESKEWLFC